MGSLQFVLVIANCLFFQSVWGQESCESLSVIGGHKVSIYDAPYIAAIIEGDDVVCVGTIVSSSFILTAASCASDGGPHRVLVGTARLNSSGQYYDVEKEICHYNFDSDTMENDICMLKLRTRIRFGRRVSKVRLAKANRNIADGTLLNVTGWGSIDSAGKKYPNRLQRTSVPKISQHCCSEVYDDITDDKICAGKQGHGACEGDGGAPLTLNNVLVGVSSAGVKGSCGSLPGIYTKVSSYLGWMKRVVQIYGNGNGIFKASVTSAF